jgi:hypothetical protein
MRFTRVWLTCPCSNPRAAFIPADMVHALVHVRHNCYICRLRLTADEEEVAFIRARCRPWPLVLSRTPGAIISATTVGTSINLCAGVQNCRHDISCNHGLNVSDNCLLFV